MPFDLRRWLARLLGSKGERLAARTLRKKGYRILATQCRQRLGEIDLIALDGDCIVFVEVKTRSTDRAGAPQESIDRHKRRCLTRSALTWLKQRRLLEHRCRFDVVAITWREGESPVIEHFIGAFDAEGPPSLFL
jgi:putative endonuclease